MAIVYDDAAPKIVYDDPPPPKASVGREAGIAGRELLGGVGDLADIPALLAHVANVAGKHVADPIRRALGLQPSTDVGPALHPGATAANAASDAMGLPTPATPGERVAGAAERALPSAVLAPENLLAGAASSAAGGAASQTAAENGAGPGLQFAAGLAGGAGPGLAVAAGKKGLQLALGVNPEVAQQNIANAAAAGTTTSVGLAAGPGSRAQVAEKLLAMYPPSAGVVRSSIEQRNAQAAGQLQDIAATLGAAGATPESTGEMLQQSLKNGWLPSQRAEVKAAYAARDAAVPQGTMVNVDRTLAAIEKQSAESPTFRQFVATDPEYKAFMAAVEKARSGGADVVTLGGVRGRLVPAPNGSQRFVPLTGNEAPASISIPYQDAAIANKGFNDHVDYSFLDGNTTARINGNLSQVAEAASGDMKSALSGIPAAQAAQIKADALYNAFATSKRQLNGVMKALTPEDAFNKLMDKAQTGSTVLAKAMEGLKPGDQQLYAGSIIQRMGVSTPGVQTAEGTAWSPLRFLTNFNEMPATSRAVLFKNLPQETQDQLAKFAKYADNVKQSQALYANPSGTAPANALLSAGKQATGAGVALVTGHPHVAALILGAMASAPVAASLMMKPGVARWLAASTTMPPSSLPVVVSQLTRYGQQTHDPAVISFAQQLQQQSASQGQ